MNKIYCVNTSCAKVNLYEAAKPKFCSHCGQSFSIGFSVAIAQVQAPAIGIRQNIPQRAISQQVIIEDNDEIDFTAFKFGVRELGKKVTLGDIQNNSAFVADSDRPAGNEFDIEQVKKANIRKFKKQDESAEVQ
jgi:hypothetical protein